MARVHVVSSARDFALRAQCDALRLDEVAVLVREYGDLAQTLAYLHHVLEHPAVTLGQVEDSFGALVASCVALLADEQHADAKEGRRLTYAKLAQVTSDDERAVALVVKAAERLADVQSCYLNEERGQLRKYRRDHRDFREAVFRPGLADGLWAELTGLVAT